MSGTKITPADDRRLRRKMADPETLLQAAETAPKLFDIGGYFRALEIMRGKGYSWRQLGEWVRSFNIEISHVHLRRLYVQESDRLDRTVARKSGGAAGSGKKKAGRRLPAGPEKQAPMVVAESFPVDSQQEDLLRYEGMSRNEAGSA